MSRMYMAKHPRCGHRRTVNSTAKDGSCLRCKQKNMLVQRAKTAKAGVSDHMRAVAKARYADKDWSVFNCGHPRTPENTATGATPRGTCRTCKLERDRAYNAEKGPARRRLAAAVADRERRRLDLSNDPARLLYLAEKARNAERRQQTIIAEAKREYEAMLERTQAEKKGGRPRKGAPLTLGKSRFPTQYHPDALLEALSPYGQGVGA